MMHILEPSLLSIYQVQSAEIAPGVVLDYDENNQGVGNEMLGLSRRAPNLDFSLLDFTAS